MKKNIMSLVIASTNKGKIKEISKALEGLPIDILNLEQFGNVPEAVEDGKTFYENALKKAIYYANMTGHPCLADDSGLVVDLLGGEPGVHSARYAGENATDDMNNTKLAAKLQEKKRTSSSAKFVCSMVLYNPEAKSEFFPILAEGICEGDVRFSRSGDMGFGYDPYFYPKGYEQSFASMDIESKNKISHRGNAIKILRKKLEDYFNND